MKFPKKFLYSEEHVWVLPKRKNIVRLGVTEYITSSDDIKEVILDVDETDVNEISTGDVIGEIVTEEGTFEIISPVSGKVVAVNREVENNTEILSESPYSEGWLVEIEIDNEDLSSYSLMDADEYKDFLDSL